MWSVFFKTNWAKYYLKETIINSFRPELPDLSLYDPPKRKKYTKCPQIKQDWFKLLLSFILHMYSFQKNTKFGVLGNPASDMNALVKPFSFLLNEISRCFCWQERITLDFRKNFIMFNLLNVNYSHYAIHQKLMNYSSDRWLTSELPPALIWTNFLTIFYDLRLV
jgi:hypothetical protein